VHALADRLDLVERERPREHILQHQLQRFALGLL